jgi:hypothetical protein
MGELRSMFVIPLSAPTSSTSVSDKVLNPSLPRVNSSAIIVVVANTRKRDNTNRFIKEDSKFRNL